MDWYTINQDTKIALILCISIIAIVISSISIITSFKTPNEEPSHYLGVTREFWLFSNHIPDLNETKMNIPHDTFSIESIHAIKGDRIMIHFFNLEEDEEHNFFIGDPYNLKVTLPAGENKTFSFDATTPGIFTYECTFHQPTMRGQLIVDNPDASKN